MAGNLDDTVQGSSLATIATVGGNAVLTLKESLTSENAEELEALANTVFDRNSKAVILDCKSVAFLDSRALEVLQRMHEELRRRGGLLKFANMNAACIDIITVTRLSNILHVYEDIPQASRSGS